ncbi:MAG: hypothetical protein A2Z05_05030 [Chloroflexi bacterium RBG_16_60_22]|nr:MAG: hypothetical protein A2Z05_05030 [Chloroflexi bacterium RBG_16_60_22]
MANTKYGKYIIREPFKKGRNEEVIEPLMNLEGAKHGGGANITLSRSWITQPFLMIKEPHTHDYDQFLIFAGGNPMDVRDFGAEVEFSLGKEGEKHIINTPTLVHIPPGIWHGPLRFTRIDRPIEFLDIFLAPEYIRK